MRRRRITAVVGHNAVTVGSFLTFVTDTDVVREHGRVRSQHDALSAMLATATLSPAGTALLPAWHELEKQIEAYLAEAPSFWRAASQMNAGQQLELDIESYRSRFAAAGVTVPPKPDLPESPAASAPGASLGKVENVLLIGAALYALTLLSRS
jgi:hypothetical protein